MDDIIFKDSYASVGIEDLQVLSVKLDNISQILKLTITDIKST